MSDVEICLVLIIRPVSKFEYLYYLRFFSGYRRHT